MSKLKKNLHVLINEHLKLQLPGKSLTSCVIHRYIIVKTV